MAIKRITLVASVLGAVFAIPAVAAPITVVNHSFEILPSGGLPNACGTGCSYSFNTGVGWALGGNGGQFQPGSSSSNFSFFNYVPDGVTTGWAGVGTLYQTIVPLAQIGTYTLQVERGVRNDTNASPGWVALTFSNTSTTVFATGTLASAGNWSTWTSTYTVGAADVGSTITIVLNGAGDQGNWDNVRLDGPVPEPASWAMMVAGFGMVGAGLRRRRVTAA